MLPLPCTLVRRAETGSKKSPAETYILDNNKQFVVGLSRKVTENHEQVITETMRRFMKAPLLRKPWPESLPMQAGECRAYVHGGYCLYNQIIDVCVNLEIHEYIIRYEFVNLFMSMRLKAILMYDQALGLHVYINSSPCAIHVVAEKNNN